jgi:hypothetical protein
LNAKATQHYLCGYGSLISHDSRYRFSDIDVEAIPVEISGWQRAWNMASPGELITCVGAVPLASKVLNGVLVAVDQIDDKLRKRERNYHFVELDQQDIALVTSKNDVSLIPDADNAKFWICQVANPQNSRDTHPICQSYVDTCLSGCLQDVDASVAQNFAVSFVEKTQGWDGFWLNDRNAPKYPRGANVSQTMQRRIDDILRDLGVLKFRREQ